MEAILKREIVIPRAMGALLSVCVFILLTVLGAFVRIPLPFTPVPLTLQTFFVLLAGAYLGAGLGAASQIGYIFLGLVGLPIFTHAGSGFLYLLGPTGGYIFGFVLASLLVGKFIRQCGNNFFAAFLTIFLADMALLLCGVIWLRFITGQNFATLLLMGLVPFIPGDILKSYAACAVYFALKSRLKQFPHVGGVK